MLRKTVLFSLPAVLLALHLNIGAQAATKVEGTLELATTVHGTVQVEHHRTGPAIVIDGAMNLQPMDMMLIVRKKEKSKHDETFEFGSQISILPANGHITIPTRRAEGGVGKNPHVWLQFFDNEGNALTEDMYLGRCKKGLKLSPSFLTKIATSLEIESADCDKEHGAYYIGGSLTFSGVNARFTFKNKLKGKRILSQTMDMNLVANDSILVIPKKSTERKLGGNPHISVQFMQDGVPMTEEIEVGRCKDL